MNLGYIKDSLPNPIFSILKNYKNCEISNDSLNHDETINMIYIYIYIHSFGFQLILDIYEILN